jgi:hypothetical protein
MALRKALNVRNFVSVDDKSSGSSRGGMMRWSRVVKVVVDNNSL